MASANTSKLQVTGLDFDSIKTNLITFFQSQEEFQDYDFTGSGLNQLLDILAYNTHYMALYLNLVANEMFLDTAVLRSTVVSHAKPLGYTPRSITASVAAVNVSVIPANTDNTSILTMPRFTQLTSTALNGTAYTFVTLDDATSQVSGNTFSFNNVTIKEGSPTVKTFVVDSQTNPNQIFDLIDTNIDTSTIAVIVQNSLTNSLKQIFTLSTDASSTTSNSNVYFLQEGTNANYQIYFGDGIIGSALNDGNIVIVSYITTNGDDANGLDTFTLQSNLLAGSTANVTTVSQSAGGSPIEDVASIKFIAPKSYAAQERSVTPNDYEVQINKNYPYFDAVNVWGGEDNIPPIYGQVFVSAKPKAGFGITVQQQQYLLQSVIKPGSVMTVTPVFVNADYNYLVLDLDVEYDSTQTTASASNLQSTIIAAVNQYANLNWNTFTAQFRVSKLLNAVDSSEQSIEGSDATVWIEKRLIPSLNTSATYVMNTGIELHRGSTTADRLYSYPAFTINDNGGIPRQAFIEETPESYSGVEQVTIVQAGSGYKSAPTITITGDGVGANAYAVIVNGQVKSVVVDKQGSDYTTASAIASGGGGSGATFNILIQGTTGVLRTYYYDNNNIKSIINSNAGVINYETGTITLNSFNPSAIADPYGVLRILVQPGTLSFGSSTNLILTLDSSDTTAISVNLTDSSTS